MDADQSAISLRRPLYAVLFSTETFDAAYHPLGSIDDLLENEFTHPHLLDGDIVPALPALWYTLHLPKSAFDIVALTVAGIRAGYSIYKPHRIFLAPVHAFNKASWTGELAAHEPILIIAPDDEIDSVRETSSERGFILSPARFSELNRELLTNHWQKLTAHWRPRLPQDRRIRFIAHKVRFSEVWQGERQDLSRARLARQMGMTSSDGSSDGLGPYNALAVLELRARVEGLANVELWPTGQASQESVIDSSVSNARESIRVPVTLALPGVSPAYHRRVREMLRERMRTDPSIRPQADSNSGRTHQDTHLEDSAIAFLAAHHAIGEESVGMVLQHVPAEAFRILADLERHWRDGPRPRIVQRMLQSLNQATEAIWNDELQLVLSRASRLHFFSNFPIGLLCAPGDTAPLGLRIPVSYGPLIPLTRSIQAELGPDQEVDFSTGFKVLVAESIEPSDPVGQISRRGWDVAADMFNVDGAKFSLERAETLNVASLRAAIAEHRPDILVLSAHGFFEESQNAAGLLIGNEPSLGFDLGPMPPFVVLSACHVGPRGGGVVAVSDLLLREGALAVLSTQVPVDVRRNATFVARLFVYLTQVVSGFEEHDDLLEVWHRVQVGNVINDILLGNRRLQTWARGAMGSGTVLTEFMMSRSNGRIRLGHAYQDAEAVLVEMVGEQGLGDKICSWLRQPGYVPESAMYSLIGDASHIHLRPGDRASSNRRERPE